MPSKEEVIEIAKQCYDPEIPVNIWDLGLIYDIEASGESVRVRMSLTSQFCPSAQQIPQELKTRLMDSLGVSDVDVQVIFDPPWTPERISEEGKKKLGLTEE